MPEHQPLPDGIADGADADLQRAAVGHEPGDVEADRIVCLRHGLARRREQRKAEFVALKQEIEFFRRHLRLPVHERQRSVDLSGEDDVRLPGAPGSEKIGRDVGIATEAVAAAGALRRRDKLRQHIDAAFENVAARMGVVGRDVVLLLARRAEPASRHQEKLMDLDVARQRSLPQRRRIEKLGIARKETLGDRLKKAPFEIARRARNFKRQCRQDAQTDRRIVDGARRQRIGDVIGLAESERQRQHDLAADPRDNSFRQPSGIVETFGLPSHRNLFRAFQGARPQARAVDPFDLVLKPSLRVAR